MMAYIIATNSLKDDKEIYLADLSKIENGKYWTEDRELAFIFQGKNAKERAEFKCMTLLYNNPRVVKYDR